MPLHPRGPGVVPLRSADREGSRVHPDTPDPQDPGEPGEDPFAALPPELRAMLEQLAGPGGLDAIREQLDAMLGPGGLQALQGGGLLGQLGLGDVDLGQLRDQLGGFGDLLGAGLHPTSGAPAGPVDWDLATAAALQLAAPDDRQPTAEERARIEEAFRIAEHWLDATPLPSPPDAGRVVVASRQEWVNAALVALRPLVEPVAEAATDALVALATEQFDQLREAGGPEAMGELLGELALPEGFEAMFEQLLGQDPAAMLRPAGAALAGLQAGQVVGQLSTQLLGQYGLGVPTAPRDQAHQLAVNVTSWFEGYGIDPAEVAIALALTEAAHRRLYQAVPWLEGHVQALVASFAQGTAVDQQRLRQISDELAQGIDPDDPEALRAAMERAAGFRMEPTPRQRRVLERLQGVVCLVGAWARREVTRASAGRLPALDRIEEVLRRNRALRGDSDDLLAALLGLDLRPDDESAGDRFVEAVEAALGPAGLHRALAHPDYLPDADELADPGRWLARTVEDVEVPDDLSALLDAGDDDAPHEASADERRTSREDPDGRADDGPTDGQQPPDSDPSG